ncbi:MAG TPA: hypothetical protein P5128_05165 [Candidatus Sumerlaeia bacterium]|nr:hypothetical protein [Candidatus Sumerlaeia bacterium]
MTLNFGTDNVYYVPEGQPLVFFDIYHMRRLDFNLERWELFYNKAHVKYIRKNVESARDLWFKHQKKNSRAPKVLKKLSNFLDELPERIYSVSQPFDIKAAVSPAEISLWVRCSDAPQESFFEEDYKEQTTTQELGCATLPVIGAFIFSSIGDYELNIHDQVEKHGFFLEIPEDGLVSLPLSPEAILPLETGFFGANGSSGDGMIINLNHESNISDENLVCAPLYRIGLDFFATLFFHLKTPVNYDVIKSFPEKKLNFARSVLAELGFKHVLDKSGNALYQRGKSSIHLYTNAVGKETIGAAFMRPFYFIASHEGSLAPAKRAQLLKEILLIFKRHSNQG